MPTLNEIIRSLELSIITSPTDFEENIEQACVSDLLSNVMATCPGHCLWVTVQCHLNVIGVASLMDITAVLLAGGVTPAEAVIAKAKEVGVVLLSSQESAFNICGKLYALGLQGVLRNRANNSEVQI